MEDRLPAPTGPLLEFLEGAIRERATIEIEYYTAGRAHRTTRLVDPLRLEWRGDAVYLIAYCHLRGDQRVFRVDRIGRGGRGERESGDREERGGRGENRE
jgi:predicted DNA-binding transcriptional regulator YafY